MQEKLRSNGRRSLAALLSFFSTISITVLPALSQTDANSSYPPLQNVIAPFSQAPQQQPQQAQPLQQQPPPGYYPQQQTWQQPPAGQMPAQPYPQYAGQPYQGWVQTQQAPQWQGQYPQQMAPQGMPQYQMPPPQYQMPLTGYPQQQPYPVQSPPQQQAQTEIQPPPGGDYPSMSELKQTFDQNPASNIQPPSTAEKMTGGFMNVLKNTINTSANMMAPRSQYGMGGMGMGMPYGGMGGMGMPYGGMMGAPLGGMMGGMGGSTSVMNGLLNQSLRMLRY